jgi:predicted aspartyl protease
MGRFLFFCLVFFVIGGEARADNGCELRRVLSIESKPDPGRHLLLPVTLMDRDTHLLLDTGGAWSVMDERFAKSLQLPFRRHTGDVQFFDAVGGRVSSYVGVPAMKINGIPLKQTFEFLVVNLGGSDRASGTMAMNFFQNMDLELDNAKRTIGLFLQRDCEGGGVHWADESTWFPFRWDGGIPVVRMQIEGKDINAVIDTGSTSTLIDLDFMRRQFGITPESPGVTKLGIATLPSGRTAEIYGYTFKSLTISGVAFQNVPAEIVDLRGGIAQLVLGMNELRFLHLYIATKEKMIYVTAADARRDDSAVMGLSAPTRPRARLSRDSHEP